MRFFPPLLFLIFLGVPAASPAEQGPEGSIKVVEPATPGLRKITHVEPVYPEQARQARIQGLVSVQVTVGTDGRVSGARLGATIPMLGQAALDAVKQWVYDPATIKTPVTLTVSVWFSVATAAPAVASRTSEGSPPALSAAGTTQGAPTTPLTTRQGFTVDVPADWRVTPPTFNEVSAYAPDGWGRVTLIDEDSAIVAGAVKLDHANLESIAHGKGTIFFRKGVHPPRAIYTIYVLLGDRAARVTCGETEGKDAGAGGCLTIVRTARFTPPSSGAPSAPPPANSHTAASSPARSTTSPGVPDPLAAVTSPSAVVPLRNLAGFTVDVPANWRQQEMGGSARMMRATSPDLVWTVILPEVTSASEAAARAALDSARKRSLGYELHEHPQGSIVRQGDPPSFSVVLGARAAHLACTGQTNPEQVLSQCLAIARTARFTGSPNSGATGGARSTSATPQAAPPSAPQGAQTGDTAPKPAPAAAPAPAGRGITGCWVYNNTINLTIFEDGRITGFLDGGKWSRIGDNRFLFTGPPSTDTLVLSDDGGILSGSNNYWGPLSAQRSSGTAQSVVGAWKWPNGATTVLSEGGEAQNGPLSGKWTQQRGNAIRIVWNFFFTDDVTLSPDGQSLSGKNMQGMPVGGRRVPCSK